ncbi:MAG: type II toxin-antitoxin system VapC family toxin [Terracidiphilus sp.]
MIYLDASFSVSLYSSDLNSNAALSTLPPANEILVLTSLAELETINALALRVFRKAISSAEADASLGIFEEDLRNGVFLRKGMADAAYERARKLSILTTARLGMRTVDLLHVAAALELGATSFFTFDTTQRALAVDSGLLLNPLP